MTETDRDLVPQPDALPATIAMLPFFAAGRFPRPDLVGRCDGTRIETIGGRELIERVRDLALGLESLGVGRGDRVALLSESRPEWLLSDFAVLALGAVSVPIYPTLAAEQVALILRDSGARAAIVSTSAQLEKVRACGAELTDFKALVVIDPERIPKRHRESFHESAKRLPVSFEALSFADLAAAGHRRIMDGWGVGRAFQDRARQVRPEDLATIIYTSGTTGTPKGVCLTHANLAANLDGIRQVLRLGPDDTALSFLPLCHAFERMVAYVYLAHGVSMIFAESIDTIPRDLALVRPTVMTAVPRVFEKLHARILETGRQTTGIRRRVFERAARLAEVRGRAATGGPPLGAIDRLWSRLAEPMVYRRIREALGGRLRFVVSGSAPLRPELGAFFFGIGVPILEGYGLTETSPVVCVTPLERPRLGRVGRPLPNLQVRVAPDGELLVRGPSVMAGYHERPDETAAVVRDGWFHTGDVGAIDPEGYVAITDRKKEVLVTSGGKKIAPLPIETALSAHVLVAAAVVVGEQRHFPAVLIVPDFEALAAALGLPAPADEAGRARLAARPEARARLQAVVDEVNRPLAQFERLKRFAVLPREFTQEAGELTPTLKVRRRVVLERWREEVDALYG